MRCTPSDLVALLAPLVLLTLAGCGGDPEPVPEPDGAPERRGTIGAASPAPSNGGSPSAADADADADADARASHARGVRLPAGVRIRRLSGLADGTVLAVGHRQGEGVIYRFGGERWAPVAVPDHIELPELTGAWGSSSRDVWLVGGYGILHYDGHWAKQTTWAYLHDAWGAGPDDVWLVGRGGTRIRAGSAGLEAYGGDAADLYAVWGSGPDDAWAVGAEGRAYRHDGLRWRRVPGLRTGADLFAVWGSGPDDVWVGGAEGALLRWDGTTWRRFDAAGRRTVTDLGGTGPDDVWACTQGGPLLRWDGRRWREADRGRGAFTVWATPDGDVWVATGPSRRGAALLRVR